MTIFDGVIDYARRRPRWPGHLRLDAAMDAVVADADSRLAALELAPSFSVRPAGIFAGFSVDMRSTDSAAEAQLRATRDRLQKESNIHRGDHGTYRFHITLAYLLRWLDATEAKAVIDASDKVGAALTARVPTLTLGPVELCRFETMHRFDPLHIRGPKS